MNKGLKELFLNTSNEVIWPKKILNSMHGLKSAILAILPPFPPIEKDRKWF